VEYLKDELRIQSKVAEAQNHRNEQLLTEVEFLRQSLAERDEREEQLF
jgi:hypothetical protein